MESEINSVSTGGGFGDGPPRLTQNEVARVLDTAEAAYLVEAYATIDELQDVIENFEDADIGDEETNTLLREARDALEKLVTSLNMPDVS